MDRKRVARWQQLHGLPALLDALPTELGRLGFQTTASRSASARMSSTQAILTQARARERRLPKYCNPPCLTV